MKMRPFSIKDKLVLVILSVTAAALIVAFTINLLTSIRRLKNDMIDDTSLLADYIGESAISPLLFNDKTGGRDILSKTSIIEWIHQVIIYDAQGNEFTRYSSKKHRNIPPLLNEPGIRIFIDDHLYVSEAITYMEEDLGQILIIASTDNLNKKIASQLLTMGIILSIILVFSYYLSLRLQKVISFPILFLADVMKKLSKDEDYSIRVSKRSNDEIGVLYDGFNEMLSQIQRRQRETQDARENIQISEARLAEAQRIASIGSWELNLQDGSMVFSDEMFRLMDLDEQSRPSLDVMEKGLSKKKREEFREYMAKARETGQRFEQKCMHKVPGRNKKYVLLRGEIQNNSAGMPVVMHGTVQDVTQQSSAELEIRKLNEKLEQRVAERTAELQSANEELEQFAYVVSHDLKAPLRGVSQLSQWLIEDFSDKFDFEGKEHLYLMKQRVHRMYKLIDGILDYSRVGRIRERKQRVDCNSVVEEIVASVEHSPTIKIEIENRMPVIYAEKTRIEQIFQNLISNAIKFNDNPEGLVVICSFDEEKYWKFCVSDNGVGIEEKYHQKIYQIFQTLAARDDQKSTGIGLTLVKKIVENLGGTIWLESEPGLGTTFYFTIEKKVVALPDTEVIDFSV